jgi:hypothetical protein
MVYLDIKSDRFKNAKIGGVNANVGPLKFCDFEPSGLTGRLKSGSKLSDMALCRKIAEIHKIKSRIYMAKITETHISQQPLILSAPK